MQLLKEIDEMINDEYDENDICDYICDYINDNLYLFSQKKHIDELVSIIDICLYEIYKHQDFTSYNESIINMYMKIIEIIINEPMIDWSDLHKYIELLQEYIDDCDMDIDLDKFNNIIIKIIRLYDKRCIELLQLCIKIYEVKVENEDYEYLYGNIKLVEIIITLIKNDQDKSICELIINNCFE